MDLISRIQVAIINPLITVLALAAFLVFIWGVIQFIRGADTEKNREEGRRHIIWGLIGLVIIFGAQALLVLIGGTAAGLFQ